MKMFYKIIRNRKLNRTCGQALHYYREQNYVSVSSLDPWKHCDYSNQACQPLNTKSKYTMYSTGFRQTNNDPFSKCIRYFVFMARDYVSFKWYWKLILKCFSDNVLDLRKLHLEVLGMKHTDRYDPPPPPMCPFYPHHIKRNNRKGFTFQGASVCHTSGSSIV